MSEQYCRSILRIALAQICQNVGWNSAQSTPLELLTDVLGRYMLQLAKVTHRYSEQFGRTDPNLDDVGLAFRHMGVSISELEEYVRHVEPAPFPHEIVQFPAPKSCNLQIPKPGHKELQTRDEHIEDYMPLLYPTPEDELDNETEKSNDQGEGSAMQVDQGQNGVGGQAEVTEGSNLIVPGDKRPMTSPVEGGLPKKRPRLTNAALPEEAMHSQYEMKSIAITHTGDLTPTKGGKLPDARTPPQGFKKASHDKPSVSKIFRKEKVDSRPSTPLSRPEKVIESSGESQRVEAVGKEREQRVEEIMIYPDGTSKKIPRQKGGGDEVSNSETVSKSASLPALEDKIPVPSPSTKVIPKKKKVGRPRSRSKSPRAPKSPGQGKSPAQPGSSPRGRGRPPKDKTLLKTPEKKKESKNIPVLSTMEEMFASDVLDLSRKPAPPAASAKENVEKKPTDVELPLDLSSKSKEKARGRGRPPLSPEKKRAREMNIDLCIEAVLKMSREGDSEGGAMKEKEVKSERIAEEMSEANQEDTNPAIEDSIDAPPSVTVKREMIEEEAASFDLSEQKKKKKKEKTPKQKEEHPSEEVKDKLKDKLKGKDFVSETVKAEPPEEEVSRPPNVYDFPESPPKPPEQVKKEVTQSPQKMFSVEFVDKEVENKEGEKVKEKSRDKPEKERSK
ncbi:transcription initiation factor TFIID subunit 3-like, partial [Saccostrea cucullata]|uniref:transcription initiation factor TFIID subunit 3-like n=1 Tax=Saccostrea cuccullata TaxID=36930 RepID=UPI002ED23E87